MPPPVPNQAPAPITPTPQPTPAPSPPATPLPTTPGVSPGTPPTPAPSNARPGKGKLIGLIVAIIVVLLLAGGAVYALTKHKPKSTATTSSKTVASSTKNSKATTTTPAQTCLTHTDYNTFLGYTVPDDIYQSFATDPYSENVHFSANVTDYDDPTTDNDLIQSWATFAKTNSNKKFSIELTGGVNADSGSTSDQQLAAARVTKTQNDLVSAGAPASRVTIGSQRDNGTDDLGSLDRVVVIALIDPCLQTTPSTGSN